MNISLSHLPAVKRRQLNDITRLIVRTARPEKIFLFGIYTNTGDSPALQPDNPLPPHIAGYDILVVTRPGNPRYDYEFQDLIENRCHHLTPLTIIVHDIHYVNKSLSQGHPFFYEILTDGILLHDAGAIPLAEPITPDFARIAQTAKHDFAHWSHQARAFLDSAEFNRQRQEPNIAAFLLHQAAEHAYQAILLTFTGYKPCTHNLDKLRRYTNRLSIELAALFPRDNPDEDHLFKLLLHSYVDARYNEEYNITDGQLLLLQQRIRRLHSIGERICRNHFISLQKRVGACP